MSQAPRRYRPSTPHLALFLLGLAMVAGRPGPGLAADGPEAAAAAVHDGTVPPRWPLDLPARWLTSNFMEYRGGRFHAGIDLKTREQEGFAAFAVEDGWICRVRATPGGYGRAVYLRGVSGRTFVYAHLARFDDRVESLVRARQARDGHYRIELELADGQVPVTRGQALGLTGQSGTPGPHLHFEVRDAAGRPIDPLAAGFAVRDSIAPVIHHVRAVAASAATKLAGGAGSLRIPNSAWRGGGEPVVRASGPVAFSALVIEATDPAGHKLEPWRLELRCDGELVYRRDNERFDFGQNAQQRLEWLECAGLREQWLHREPAVAVAGREGGSWHLGRAGNGLVPGRHRLELTAADRAGNRAQAAWWLEVLPPGTEPGPAPAETDPTDLVADDGDNDICHMVLAPLFEVFPDSCASQRLRLEPGDDGVVLAPVQLAVRSDQHLDARQRARAAAQGLVPAGMLTVWQAAAWPMAGEPLVEVPGDLAPPSPAPVRQVGEPAMYRWDGDGWRHAGPLLAPRLATGPARFALPRPGSYAAMRDTVPPLIDAGARRVGPHPGYGRVPAGLTPPRWEILAIGVRDDGAGVDAASIVARWDGAPLVVEPDLLRDRVLVQLPDSTRSGAHVLELAASDATGRVTTARLAVRCGVGAGR